MSRDICRYCMGACEMLHLRGLTADDESVEMRACPACGGTGLCAPRSAARPRLTQGSQGMDSAVKAVEKKLVGGSK